MYLLMAVSPVSLTCTVISVDDGLLRTSTGCAGPASSLTLYADWLKVTTVATEWCKNLNDYFNNYKCNKCWQQIFIVQCNKYVWRSIRITNSYVYRAAIFNKANRIITNCEVLQIEKYSGARIFRPTT